MTQTPPDTPGDDTPDEVAMTTAAIRTRAEMARSWAVRQAADADLPWTVRQHFEHDVPALIDYAEHTPAGSGPRGSCASGPGYGTDRLGQRETAATGRWGMP